MTRKGNLFGGATCVVCEKNNKIGVYSIAGAVSDVMLAYTKYTCAAPEIPMTEEMDVQRYPP